MSQTTGDGPTQSWKNLQAQLNDGKKITLVTHLTGRHTEEALLQELRRRAGLIELGARPQEAESQEWDKLMDLPEDKE